MDLKYFKNLSFPTQLSRYSHTPLNIQCVAAEISKQNIEQACKNSWQFSMRSQLFLLRIYYLSITRRHISAAAILRVNVKWRATNYKLVQAARAH